MNTNIKNSAGFTVRDLRTHRRFCRAVGCGVSFFMMAMSAAPAFAATAVLGGSASLDQATGATLSQNTDTLAQFTSSSASAVLDWSKFDIGSGQEMNFNGSGTTFFNLVNATAGKSQIDGMISGNGSVWVINPNGIAFGASSTVNVGGLFAAAAGNIENADALRNGTATMPSFPELLSEIKVGEPNDADSVKFIADRVALFANHVAVNKAEVSGVQRFTVVGVKHANLSMVPVDQVNGGMINIDIDDWSYGEGTGVDIGDLISSGTVGIVGGGSIDVSGKVTVENGSLSVHSINGDINIGKDAVLEIESNGSSVELSSACLDSTWLNPDDGWYYVAFAEDGSRAVKGDVNVEGCIRANAEGASVKINSAVGSYTEGEINIQGVIENVTETENEAGGGIFLNVGNWYDAGDGLRIEGSVESDANVTGAIYNGPAEILGHVKGEVVNIGTVNGDIIVGDGISDNIGVEARSIAWIGTYSGDVRIEKGASVDVSGDAGQLEIYSAQSDGAQGDIYINGSLNLSGDNGFIQLKSSYADGSEGSVVVEENGEIVSIGEQSEIFVISGNGEGSKGNVVVNGLIGVEGDHGYIGINGGYGDKSEGSVAVEEKGEIVSIGDQSRIFVTSGNGEGSKGDVVVNGLIGSAGDNSYINIAGGYGDKSEGSVIVSGTIEIGGESSAVNVGSAIGEGANGDIMLQYGGMVSVYGKDSMLCLSSAQGENAHGSLDAKGHVAAYGDNAVVVLGSGLGNGSESAIDISGDIMAVGNAALVSIESGTGDASKSRMDVSGSVDVSGKNSQIQIITALGEHSQGEMNISGSMVAEGEGASSRLYAAAGNGTSGDMCISGVVKAKGENSHTLLVAGFGSDSNGKIDVPGFIGAEGAESSISVVSGYGTGAVGDVKISGGMNAAKDSQIRVDKGNVTIDGTVEAGNVATVIVSGDETHGGNIIIGDKGVVKSDSIVNLIAEGNISHIGNKIDVGNGFASKKDIYAAVETDMLNISAGGNVGENDAYFGIKGNVYAKIEGDAYIAAASGSDFRGGDAANAPSSVEISGFEHKIDSFDREGTIKSSEVIVEKVEESFNELKGTSAIVTKGNLSVYTVGKLEANGLLKAGGDLTVSAAKFGDVSYLHAGGKLTVNNVGKPGSPQIAYFESVNGVEPRINNMPNDTVIFVDGRLAGGNTQIINTFGANEAFMVQTPELKSTQGIFGNPMFMHSDLDVANPLEVSAIDYMIQDIPRLTLSTDFPAEVDRNVEANGLSARDSIWFGQEKANAKNDESEEKSPEDDKPENDKAQVANTLASIR